MLCYTAISTANIPRPPYLVYSICSITIIAFLISYSCFFLNFLINYIIGYFSVAFICFDFAIKSSYGSSNFFSNYNTWTSLSFLRTDYFLSIHLLLIFSSSIFFQPTLVCRTSSFCLAFRVKFLRVIWSFICTIHYCIWIRAMDLTRFNKTFLKLCDTIRCKWF